MSDEIRPLPMPTHIGRTVDLSVPSNRNILIFSLVVMVLLGGYRLLTGTALDAALFMAVGGGMLTFLAWAIGRELDPDYNITATIAAGLLAIAVFIWPLPYLLSTGLVLLLLRVISRSTGLPPTQLDSIAIFLGTGLTVALDGFWGIGLLIALMFALDVYLLPRAPQRSMGFAIRTLAITAVASILTGMALVPSMLNGPLLVTVVLVSALYILLLERPQPALEAVGDMTGEPLQPTRISVARLLAVISGLLLFFTAGTTGVLAVLPLWAAIIGSIVRRFIQKFGG